MRRVVRGMLNKKIAAELDIAEITVKVHRRHVMDKMGAGSLAELVRMVDRAEPGLDEPGLVAPLRAGAGARPSAG